MDSLRSEQRESGNRLAIITIASMWTKVHTSFHKNKTSLNATLGFLTCCRIPVYKEREAEGEFILGRKVVSACSPDPLWKVYWSGGFIGDSMKSLQGGRPAALKSEKSEPWRTFLFSRAHLPRVSFERWKISCAHGLSFITTAKQKRSPKISGNLGKLVQPRL